MSSDKVTEYLDTITGGVTNMVGELKTTSLHLERLADGLLTVIDKQITVWGIIIQYQQDIEDELQELLLQEHHIGNSIEVLDELLTTIEDPESDKTTPPMQEYQQQLYTVKKRIEHLNEQQYLLTFVFQHLEDVIKEHALLFMSLVSGDKKRIKSRLTKILRAAAVFGGKVAAERLFKQSLGTLVIGVL